MKVHVNKLAMIIAAVIMTVACGGAWALSFGELKQRARAQQGQFWRDVGDIVIKMTSTQDGAAKNDAPLKVVMTSYMKKDRSRIDIVNGAFKNTIITRGNEYWSISNKGIFSGVTVEHNDKVHDWYTWLGAGAEITGEETIDSRPCYKIEAMTPEPVVVWVDKKSILPREMKYTEQDSRIRYMNFRAIKGAWEFPYIIAEYKAGIKLSEQIVDSIAVNQGIKDDVFDYRAVASREYRLKENAPVNVMPDMGVLRQAMEKTKNSGDMPDEQKQKMQEMIEKMKQSQPANH